MGSTEGKGRLGALAHLRAAPLRLVVAIVALGLGGLAGMPTSEAVYSYMWRDSRFCDDCHVHDYANEGWARSLHAELTTCHDCHRVPISHYPRNLWKALFARPTGQDDIHRPHVATVICEQCHSDAGSDEPLTGPMPRALRGRIPKIDESPLHRLHLDCDNRTPSAYCGGGDDSAAGGAEDPGITCMDCHGGETNRAHRFEATADNCKVCHEHTAMREGRMSLVSCRECHFAGFLAPGPPGGTGAEVSGGSAAGP